MNDLMNVLVKSKYQQSAKKTFAANLQDKELLFPRIEQLGRQIGRRNEIPLGIVG